MGMLFGYECPLCWERGENCRCEETNSFSDHERITDLVLENRRLREQIKQKEKEEDGNFGFH
jgi:hypothetical protein